LELFDLIAWGLAFAFVAVCAAFGTVSGSISGRKASHTSAEDKALSKESSSHRGIIN
jgi:TRAP-type C4-dicarboxylate transport system permease large subunit